MVLGGGSRSSLITGLDTGQYVNQMSRFLPATVQDGKHKHHIHPIIYTSSGLLCKVVGGSDFFSHCCIAAIGSFKDA